MSTATYTDEIHTKARLLHEQIAALSHKAQEAADPAALAALLCAPYYRLLDQLYEHDLPWARAMDDSDMVVRLRGAAADQDAPKVGLLSDTLDLLRDQVQSIAKALMHALPDSKWPSTLDLGLSAFARGSIVLGLKLRSDVGAEGDVLAGVDARLFDATREAIHKLGEVVHFVDEDGVHEEMTDAVPDPAMRDILLTAASKLAPTGRRGVDSVELINPGYRAGTALTPRVRTALRHALVRPVRQQQRMVLEGVVREVDLDLKRFELRQVEGLGNVRCIFIDLSEAQARAMLGASVSVDGNAACDPEGRPRLLQADKVSIQTIAGKQTNLALEREEPTL